MLKLKVVGKEEGGRGTIEKNVEGQTNCKINCGIGAFDTNLLTNGLRLFMFLLTSPSFFRRLIVLMKIVTQLQPMFIIKLCKLSMF